MVYRGYYIIPCLLYHYIYFRKSGARRNDIIDLLVDELKDQGKVATTDTNCEEAETDEFEKDAAIDVSSISSKTEIDMEIALISNALIFFFAGFDTTSTTLGTAIFALIKNPQYQERVREEIEEVVGDSQDIKFEHLQVGKREEREKSAKPSNLNFHLLIGPNLTNQRSAATKY